MTISSPPTRSVTGLIYVSRLLTDRAMSSPALAGRSGADRVGSTTGSRRTRSGHRGRQCRRHHPDRARRCRSPGRRRAAAEGHRERRGRVRQHRSVRGRSCGSDRHQHPRRPRPRLRGPHLRVDSRRHSSNHRGRQADSQPAALGLGAADAGRTRHQRRRHARHPRLRPNRPGGGTPRARLRHDRHRVVAQPNPGQRRERCHLRRHLDPVGRQRRRHRPHPSHCRDAPLDRRRRATADEADRVPDQHRPRWRRRRSGVDRGPAQRPDPRCRSGCVRR